MSLTQPNAGAGDPQLAAVARRAQLGWALWVSEDGFADSCRPEGGAGQYRCGSAIASAPGAVLLVLPRAASNGDSGQ
jgi:hypothetical protein